MGLWLICDLLQLVVLHSFYGLRCVLLVDISYAAELTDTNADAIPAFDPWNGDLCLIFGSALLPDCEIQVPSPPTIAPSSGEVTVETLLAKEPSDGAAIELYGFYGIASKADAFLADRDAVIQSHPVPTVAAAPRTEVITVEPTIELYGFYEVAVTPPRTREDESAVAGATPDTISTSAGQFYGLHHDRRYSATAVLHLKNACGEEELNALAAYLRARHATRSAESIIHREVMEDAIHVQFTDVSSALYGIGCMVTVNITYDAAPLETAEDPGLGPTDPWDGDLCAMLGEFLMPELCASSNLSPPATPSPPIIPPQTQPFTPPHVTTEVTVINAAFYGFYGLRVMANRTDKKLSGEGGRLIASQAPSQSDLLHPMVYGLRIGERLSYGAQQALPLASPCDNVDVANLRRTLQRYHADRGRQSTTHAVVDPSQVLVIITLQSELYGLSCVADVRIAYEAEPLDDVEATNDDATVVTDPWDGDPCLMFGPLLQGCEQGNPTAAVSPPPSASPPPSEYIDLHPREGISVTVELYGFYGHAHPDTQSIAMKTPDTTTDRLQSTQPPLPPDVSQPAVYGLDVRSRRLYGALQTLALTGVCGSVNVAALRSTLQMYHADLSRLSTTHAAVEISQITVNITLRTALYGLGCVAEVGIQYAAEPLDDADVEITGDDAAVVTDPWDGDLCLMFGPLLPECTPDDAAAVIPPPQTTVPSPPM
ncbi:hypothetical protein CYMTET_14965 [Cymbomonas tetramitiformis]|uniref:Uncharacterized protein n=1 Tax=Cymbomonas tetramitiformis TaxID=36881 RepID=A0AAE0GFG8_9CHLO|nr:hypothetical protein CYMTET_14965 [Cymbomonas tetramitiformis]